MKTCKVCGIDKTEDEFYKRKGRQDNRCKLCHQAYRKEHYLNNKEMYLEKARRNGDKSLEIRRNLVIDYLNAHPCVDCGETDIRCLQFDHEDPSTKSFSISHGVGNSLEVSTILEEISKCSVRCANCHSKRTAEQFGFYTHKHLSSI